MPKPPGLFLPAIHLGFHLVAPCLACLLTAGAVSAHPCPQPTAQAPLPRPTGAAVNRGVLLLAHGGDPSWDARVHAVAADAGSRYPVEVALGMASKRTIQEAIDRLEARGVTEIVAVPLFVSSHSSVVAATEYLLGIRAEAPPDLAIFARMDHGSGGHGAHETPPAAHGHAGADAPALDPTTPVRRRVPIRMTRALDDDPLVADILVDRATAISHDPSKEVVVLVAHGPVPDDDNARWLDHMGRLAALVRERIPFARVDYLTVRDDAGEPVRAAAAAELRAVVNRGRSEGRRVLVVPLLLAYGGIEAGIRTRLEGLEFTMSPQALLPDARVARWIVDRVDRLGASAR